MYWHSLESNHFSWTQMCDLETSSIPSSNIILPWTALVSPNYNQGSWDRGGREGRRKEDSLRPRPPHNQMWAIFNWIGNSSVHEFKFAKLFWDKKIFSSENWKAIEYKFEDWFYFNSYSEEKMKLSQTVFFKSTQYLMYKLLF